MKQYLFAYGSLINHSSLTITAPQLSTQPILPVTIDHLQRSFNARLKLPRYHYQGLTAMGVEFTEGQCNGVVLQVEEEAWELLDGRERGYTRKEIDVRNVYACVLSQSTQRIGDHEILRDAVSRRKNVEVETNSQVWVYVPNNPTFANEEYPIFQTYVDVILQGCDELHKDFGRLFVKYTHGWWHDDDASSVLTNGMTKVNQQIWINDRSHPLYIRADIDVSDAVGWKFDEMLEELVGEAFAKRGVVMLSESGLSVEEDVE